MSPSSPIELSIVIVTYNNGPEIEACLGSIIRSPHEAAWEAIIVDNHSTDATLECIQHLRETASAAGLEFHLIRNSANAGFTRAVNQGLERSRGDFIVLLNPDTEVRPDSLIAMMQRLQADPSIGLIGPQLRYPDGSVQPSCRRFPRRRDVMFHLLGLNRIFPRNPYFNHWKMPAFDHRSETDVEQPQGACLMTHRRGVETVGPLDERFFMFFSDVDWCRRFIDAGWRIRFVPDIVVIHHKGASVHRARARMILTSHKSFYDYFCKFYRRPVDRFLNAAIGTLLLLAAFLRMSYAAADALRRRFFH